MLKKEVTFDDELHTKQKKSKEREGSLEGRVIATENQTQIGRQSKEIKPKTCKK